MVLAGCFLLVTAFLTLQPFQNTVLEGGVFRLLSSDGIISRAGTMRGASIEEWGELRRRTLTAERREQLALNILERRRNGARLDWHEFDWFDTGVILQTLPAEVIDCYFLEWNDYALELPERASIGEAVSAQLDVDYYHTQWLDGNPTFVGGGYFQRFIAFGGYWINDDPLPQLRGTSLIPASTFGWGAYRDERNPQLVLHPQEAGPLEVHARLWIVVLPNAIAPTLAWDEDGTPQFPPETIWSGMVELSTTANIED